MKTFELDQLVADCRAALAVDRSFKHVREVVARAVSDPAAVLRSLGEPTRAGLHKLYHADDLTILLDGIGVEVVTTKHVAELTHRGFARHRLHGACHIAPGGIL